MKVVPIHELKRNLSSLVDEAAAGEQILVTRHRRPVACLVPSALRLVHKGRRCGKRTVKPVLQCPTKGEYLAALLEDRQPASGNEAR